MPDLPDSADDPRRERLCEHPLVKHFLGTPLHVLAQGGCGRKGGRIVRHVWNGGEAVWLRAADRVWP